MTPEYIKSLKSLSDEEKSVMLKGLEKKKTLTFADNKGKCMYLEQGNSS